MNITKSFLVFLSTFIIIFIFTSINVTSQTKIITKKGNEFICILNEVDNQDFIEIQYLNGKIDTLRKRLIKRRTKVSLDILTISDTLSNVVITEIQPNFYTINQNEKSFRLSISEVIKIDEHIPLLDTLIDTKKRALLGIGIGLPFLYLSYDKLFYETSGFRVTLFSILFAGGVLLDVYWNFPVNMNIEHNFSLTSGLVGVAGFDGGSGSGATLLGASYDLKLYFLMIRAGLLYGITGYTANDLILPNVSIGVVFKL